MDNLESGILFCLQYGKGKVVIPINLQYYEEYGREEYGFNRELSREIAALADKLGVPVYRFMDNCFDLVVDIQSDPDYLLPEVETAINLGINSPNEL